MIAIVGGLAVVVAWAAGTERRSSGALSHETAHELKNFVFEQGRFYSNALAREVPYGIYLPRDHKDNNQTSARWPLVIWLHGMWEDHLRFRERGGEPVLDRAVSDGKLPPCVFVLAEAGPTSLYVNRGCGANFEDLVHKDLLKHVRKRYPVCQTRGQSALMGISMGGMAALRIAFKHPELFGVVAAHSAAMFAEDPEQLSEQTKEMVEHLDLDEVLGKPIDKQKWEAINPLCLVAKLEPKALQELKIYFDAGTRDRFGFDAGNRRLHEILAARGIDHTWNLVREGGHAWGSGFKEQSLIDSLTVVGGAFRTLGGAR